MRTTSLLEERVAASGKCETSNLRGKSELLVLSTIHALEKRVTISGKGEASTCNPWSQKEVIAYHSFA